MLAVTLMETSALGFKFSDGKLRDYRPKAKSVEDLASSNPREGRGRILPLPAY